MTKEDELFLGEILFNRMNLCGCVEIEETMKPIIKLFHWSENYEEPRASFNDLFGGEGEFYLITTLLEQAELIEHGIAIRCPIITEDGRRFLDLITQKEPVNFRAIDRVYGE